MGSSHHYLESTVFDVVTDSAAGGSAPIFEDGVREKGRPLDIRPAVLVL